MLVENALELQSFKWSSKIVLQLANVFVDGLEPQNFKCLNKIELSMVDVENFIETMKIWIIVQNFKKLRIKNFFKFLYYYIQW